MHALKHTDFHLQKKKNLCSFSNSWNLLSISCNATHMSFSFYGETGTWKGFNSIHWVQPNTQMTMRLLKKETLNKNTSLTVLILAETLFSKFKYTVD